MSDSTSTATPPSALGTQPLAWPARLGLLSFLWGVVALLTWLIVGRVLPHLLPIPVAGGVLGVFMATVLVSLYLGAVQITARVLRGAYPAAHEALAAVRAAE